MDKENKPNDLKLSGGLHITEKEESKPEIEDSIKIGEIGLGSRILKVDELALIIVKLLKDENVRAYLDVDRRNKIARNYTG